MRQVIMVGQLFVGGAYALNDYVASYVAMGPIPDWSMWLCMVGFCVQ